MNTRRDITINGARIALGTRHTLDLPVARLYTHAPMTMPVHVVRGKEDGPRVFVSAAIHGDEINGVEIIRRLLKLHALKRLKGTLIAVPIVNVHGFIHHTRYLPDRRDLNRSFPGSDKGSLAARLAHLFMTEIVSNCTHGIDIHTGAIHRSNLPQIRANLDDPETDRLARAFGAPVLLNADLRDGSLRQIAAEKGIHMLLYEAGEALRFDEMSIRAGLSGIVEVLRALEMLPKKRNPVQQTEPVVARSSTWVRAPQSGIVRLITPLGGRVRKGESIAIIADPFRWSTKARRCTTSRASTRWAKPRNRSRISRPVRPIRSRIWRMNRRLSEYGLLLERRPHREAMDDIVSNLS
jgi:predicted deacylase